MNKKWTIDFQEVYNRDIPPDLFMYLLCLYFRLPITEEVLTQAHKLGLSIKDIDHYDISHSGISLVERVLVASESSTKKTNVDYIEIAKQLMSVFPRGIKPDTSSYWRGNKELVADRLRILELTIQKEIPLNIMLQATKDYVDSFKGDRQYMQTLPYFIFKYSKNIDGEIEWQSNLLTTIENKEYEHSD